MRIPDEIGCSDPLKAAAIAAFKRVVDPLVDLMFDTGITVHEFGRLVRDRAVRVAATRISTETGRVNNSRVAIATGLARSEVARILLTTEPIFDSPTGQHPARKVLAAWYDNRKFLDVSGEPLVLPIFGGRRSFEYLVATYGGGIPVRAMLDQLSEVGSIEVLTGQRVKVKARVPVFKGMTANAVTNVGERAGDLLETLRSNLHATGTPLFEGTALIHDLELGVAPLVRREIAEQATTFIDTANSLLNRSRKRSNRKGVQSADQRRVGVTVYYFEDALSAEPNQSPSNYKRRKNFRRRSKAKKGLIDRKNKFKAS